MVGPHGGIIVNDPNGGEQIKLAGTIGLYRYDFSELYGNLIIDELYSGVFNDTIQIGLESNGGAELVLGTNGGAGLFSFQKDIQLTAMSSGDIKIKADSGDISLDSENIRLDPNDKIYINGEECYSGDCLLRGGSLLSNDYKLYFKNGLLYKVTRDEGET